MEEWRLVKGYEGYYEVSNTEKVRSLDRFRKGKHGAIVPLKGKILNTYYYKDSGKPAVHLYKNGVVKRYFFSIIVAKAFPEICGEWFEGAEVHHKDRNPNNNVPSNLLVVSPQEHRQIHEGDFKNRMTGEHNPFYGKQHPKNIMDKIADKHKKPVIQYTEDGEYIKTWKSATDAGKVLGITKNNIGNVLKKRNHTCRAKDNNKYIFRYYNHSLLQYRQGKLQPLLCVLQNEEMGVFSCPYRPCPQQQP